jgi:hypothetical protein
MAPDIPKVDPDRHPDPGAAAWYFRDEVLRAWDFCDEVLRCLFHGKQSPPSGRPAHPISQY